VWSGQHYSENLKDVFFSQLGVDRPDYEMSINTDSEPAFIGRLIPGLSELIEQNKPAMCCFLGDTNTVLGSIACAASAVPIVHIEGCMRSYDWRMPEERYRTIIDHLADVIYAYLPNYKQQGLIEGIDARSIVVTGNPIVDVLEHYFTSGRIRFGQLERDRLFDYFRVAPSSFALMTCHRRENVENAVSLSRILDLASTTGLRVILPASYRTQRSIKQLGLGVPDNVYIVDPIGYAEFLELLVAARYVLTDSGTVVEEAAVLGTPSVQMRSSTERPEVYECGASIKFDPHMDSDEGNWKSVLSRADGLHGTEWVHGLGDGRASERIAEDLVARLDGRLAVRGHDPRGSGKPYQRNWGE
jgi:UDP-N-acetylglucosamine 2-epimerase (non-hydrolysing)